MKKNGVLNSQLSYVLASLGHTDSVVVCDCGLPIPRDREKVDLALIKNVPRFIETVRVVLEEIHVEKAIIATELESVNPKTYAQLMELLDGIETEKMPHEQFKQLSAANRSTAFVRTGEASPFANVILVSGVDFD
ncbi:MAG TPA: D-ribose pyranase [Bacteroidota bacterium]|nr:D-ribose pyranase [Bacteroidota bacterium]